MVAYGSETQPHGELHHARIARRGDLPELRRGHGAGRVVPLRCCIDRAELCVIEGVVGLGAKLRVNALTEPDLF
jgi:hypothetical protein